MSTSPPRLIKIGLLGCGNVGAALVDLIDAQTEAIRDRIGIELAVTRIAVRSLTPERIERFGSDCLTDDPAVVVADPEVDLVVELIGGIRPALDLTLAALGSGRPVVTGNKELVAAHGPQLFAAAEAGGVDFLFEAAVAGGIPLMRPLRESLLGEPIARVMGIVNGTTNYILSQMADVGADYAEALAEAQEQGFAEADPTADVEGHDAAAKAAIIATIAFGASVSSEDVHCEGISGVTADDISAAAHLGMVVKLLAVAERLDLDGVRKVNARVHPTLVPSDHPLASVRGSFNAVFIEGDAVDDLMLYGRGAGGMPTASAVLGDLLDAAGNLSRSTAAPFGTLEPADLAPLADVDSAFYVATTLVDAPGVLAEVADVFGRHGVSIRSMEQHATGEGTDEAAVVFITHTAREAAMDVVLSEVGELDSVRRVGTVMRVIGVE